MQKYLVVLAGTVLLLSSMVFVGGCSCGFDCNNDDNRGTTTLSLGFSDALPEDLKQVVIEVDSITLRRNNGDDVVVNEHLCFCTVHFPMGC